MIFLEELEYMKLYKKPFQLPIENKDKKHGSCILLLTPNYNATVDTLNNPLLINRYYESYFIEKDITYFINQEGFIDRDSNSSYILESEILNEGFIKDSSKEVCVSGVKKSIDLLNSRIKELESITPTKSYKMKKIALNIIPLYGSIIEMLVTNARTPEQVLQNEIFVCKQYLNLMNSILKTLEDDSLTLKKYYSIQLKMFNNVAYKIGSKKFINKIVTKEIHAHKKAIDVLKRESDKNTILSKGVKDLFRSDTMKPVITSLFVVHGLLIGPIGTYVIYNSMRNISHSEDIIKILESNIEMLESALVDLKINESHSLSNCLNGEGEELISEKRGSNIAAKFKNPKAMATSLKKKIRKVKYQSNKMTDLSRNNVGTINNKKAIVESYDLVGYMGQPYDIKPSHIRVKVNENDIMFFNNENLDESILNEASKQYNPVLKKLLYDERFRNNKEVFMIYEPLKTDVPYIKKTFLDINKYKNLNLFVDLFYYNQSFFRNNVYKLDKGVGLYLEFISRFILDKRLDPYSKRTVIVPVDSWAEENNEIFNYKEGINPISMIVRLIKNDPSKLNMFKGIDFVFLTQNAYFKVDLSSITKQELVQFQRFIDNIQSSNPVTDDEEKGLDSTESKKSIVANIIDKLEDNEVLTTKGLTGEGESIDKKELIDKIEKAAATAKDTDEAIDKLEEDESVKELILKISAEEDNTVKINKARLDRMNKVKDQFLEKELEGRTVRDILDNSNKQKEIPVTNLDIDTVNEEWSELTYTNFEKIYDIDEDILAALNHLSTLPNPVMVRDINKEDTSTSEDLVYTYTVQLEDYTGARFKLVFDIPKFKDGNRFMLLRGNDKTISGQLALLPISKTDEDTVQIVSNYKKIFIRRYGSTSGKSYVCVDKLVKVVQKHDVLRAVEGDNKRICEKYDLPIDYVDLCGLYSSIENKTYKFYFNQDEIRKKYKIDDKKGTPIGIRKSDDSVIYADSKFPASYRIVELLKEDKKFEELYNQQKSATKYNYSKASILNNHIPLIVVMAYSEGLIMSMDKANIEYEIVPKRPESNDLNDFIKFKDGFLSYKLDYNSSLLMNGLKECNTEDYSLADINGKAMWLDFLDIFGGRILADGIENFYDLMLDPITLEVLRDLNLPTDYITVLAYANMLLSDNSYVKHTDMKGRRYRTNELIAGYFYQSLAEAYGEYRTLQKKSRRSEMSMKKAIVLDKVLVDPTCSDASSLNDLLELESKNTVSYKGLSGLNSDRGYSVEKRTYDPTMLNVIGLSTGFAGNVGISRQATMDMNITGKRGYIKTIENDTDKLSITKTFTATEALTPFGATRDDPFRTAMTFIQTAKHGMRVTNGMPLLISNGSDQALPYLSGDTFAYKAKKDGKIEEKTDEYMIIKYNDGTSDFVDLRNTVKKNSNGGFYLSIKLDSDYKVGKKVKAGEIVAYDKLSYSNAVGHTDNIAYNLGVLTKLALMNTDEGFEDSAIISEWLSDAMSSDVVVKKEINLPKSTNIYNMVDKGTPIEEGDPLIVFQNAFEEDDVNSLLKNLADDEGIISDLGRIPVKSKITGVVEDIKIFRTTELDELSPSLKKKVRELEKPTKDLRAIMKKYDINEEFRLDPDYKLEQTGKVKNVDEGVLIQFFLKYEDKMSIGDKLVYYSALKGVVKDIYPKGEEPYTDFRPDEKIHTVLALGSVSGRMVASVIVSMALNKVLIELDRSCKDLAGIPFKYLDGVMNAK